ncbi:uncharacterized protein LOC6561068 isoform X5 [Drosophila grimshawi]|uniref:uncharacterized protein LOC6561068 isoform X5 n=1 Tax=Drosophila grimshawi TaxID=7222 RepID=UPI001C932ADE|nr:uncharacterized protein LOC6561068 isoform X5 [Drosophila grimshawi]
MQTRSFKLEQRSRSRSAAGCVTVALLLIAALVNIDTAAGRPDVRQSPFSLDLQPPLAEANPTDFARAVDSYGNPIDALRPIDTPDGRKVVSAEGVQFEIPNYASGITEIRKPSDDLLPPHTARFDPPPSQSSATTSTKPEPQQFPPGNGNPVDGQKVEYSKSDDGKVISTPLNTQRNDVQGSSVHQGSSTASFGSAAPTAATAASNTGKYTGGFGAPAGLLRPLSSSKPDIYVAGNKHEFNIDREKNRRQQQSGNTGRYTGGFGAPDGVLSPQNAPRPFQPTQQTQQSQQPSRSLSNQHSVGAASSHNQHRQNRFGGPPGILVPFDNVQRTGGQ